MKLCKAIGVSLVLTGLLSACSSVPLIENTTGINLLETNKPVHTLVNLHPDMNNLRLYTVNYQQDGLIPRCTPVKIQQFNKKILSFKDLSDERTYTLIKHGSSPDFVAYLNKYFGTACDRTIGAYGANQKYSTSSIAANKSFILSSCTHINP
jgi:hypothetical protein